MPPTFPPIRAYPNATRYRRGDAAGHYESFFQRANHPTRPLAFWIRYTIFSPAGRPRDAVGELWAIHFDGETGEHVAVKTERPIAECRFGERDLHAEIAGATLVPGELKGEAASGGHKLDWDLRFEGDEPPVLFLAEKLIEGRFPRAKGLVPRPMVTYGGVLEVDGRRVEIDGWIGSQNHNWGSRHTDHYAWGQVQGFDEHARSYLEVLTARLRYGPLWTPFMTPLVLRHGGRELVFNTVQGALRTRGRFRPFHWEFAARTREVSIEGAIWAPRDAFVGLRYNNPPGGFKHCLNTKIASAEVIVDDQRSGQRDVLTSRHRAAFEILTDDRSHGVEIRA